jgi:hypothetical protein
LLIYEINDKPFNITYSYWTAKWCKWAYSIAKDHHPVYDNTGEFMGKNGKILYGSSPVLLDILFNVIVTFHLIMLYSFPF